MTRFGVFMADVSVTTDLRLEFALRRACPVGVLATLSLWCAWLVIVFLLNDQIWFNLSYWRLSNHPF